MADYTYFKRKLMDGSQVTHMELNVVEGAVNNPNIAPEENSAQQMLNLKPNEDPDVILGSAEIRPVNTKESEEKMLDATNSNTEENVSDKNERKKSSKSKQKKKKGSGREKMKVTEGKGKRASKKGKTVKKSKRKGKNSTVKTESGGNKREEETNSVEEMQMREKESSRKTEEITSKVTKVEQSSEETKETQLTYQPTPKPRRFEMSKQIQPLSFGTTEISSGKRGIGGRGKINPGVSKLLAFPMGKVDILMRSLMPHKAKLSKKGIQEVTTLLQVYVVFILRHTISFKPELKTVDGKDIRKSIGHHSTLSLIQNIIKYK